MLTNKLALLLCLLGFAATAQVDSLDVAVDSVYVDSAYVEIDSVEIELAPNVITNTSSLTVFLEKLYQLDKQKQGKVNIVHIGDSHIQADLMTGMIRKNLQSRFGNAGCGFTFPHSLAKTNGGHYVRFNSNASWQSRRNIYSPEAGMNVGLSGIALTTRENFVVEINVKNPSYHFNTIRVISPDSVPAFDLATASKTIVLESTEPKKITHRIKSGEVLGSIASKYGTTVSAIKKANGLKSDNIRAGKTLKIPTRQMEKREIKRSEFIPLTVTTDERSPFYHSDAPLSKIYLLPNGEHKNYTLSGLVLEKDDPGLVYHSIGVNGAKASDYNKYPLFFRQLPALDPDLVVVSLGTNESFDKMPAADYMVQLNLFIDNVKAQCPDACIIIMTPPPSLFRKRYPNTFAADYAKHILIQETDKNYASWDLFSEMGGLFGVGRNAARGIIGGDKVHYTKPGYEKQGNLFTEALLTAFDNYKTNRD